MPCDGKNGKRPRVELLINNGVEAKLFLMRKIIPQGVIFFGYWLTYVYSMLICSMEKIILTDVDGVLLNWEYAFVTWMEEHGYKMIENGNFIYNIKKRFNLESNNKGHKLIRQFNESATIGYLPALRDSQHYVKLLGNLGYKFHVITSLSKNPNAQRLRTKNLEKLFGKVFEKFIYLDTGEDKDAVLEQYRDTGLLWVEDKPANAEVGINMGLKAVIMEHAFNLHYEGAAPFVKNWADIYTLVTGNPVNINIDIA